MIKLSKKTDYSVQAILQMARTEESGPLSSREIAAAREISPKLMAKLLQSLSASGICRSTQGAQGGYSLSRPLSDISVHDVMCAVDGPLVILSCLDPHKEPCPRLDLCGLKSPMAVVQQEIAKYLASVKLDTMLNPVEALPPGGEAQ